MSTQSTPAMPTHRGFSSKAREILLDPPGTSTMQQQQAKLGNIQESPSRAPHSLRRLFGLAKMDGSFRRTDSVGSQKSNSSTKSSPVKDSEFDNLDDFPKVQKQPKVHKLLGEIGKTKSANDLLRKTTIIRTFQQQNIMRLPSVDSDLEHASRYRNIVQRDEDFDGFSYEGSASRKSAYEMK
ncbi:hypothetical protein QR680_003741 [Steinernema hermaphroditum]|uniref:Uncharacterized protein n=1 Tax=Steinernema hermaphroditum TaxID=289476 RepID=A0AA39HNM4_9BILA|nr:hypothetical protein QR680_003741 [Steinernema hermaphroditum]